MRRNTRRWKLEISAASKAAVNAIRHEPLQRLELNEMLTGKELRCAELQRCALKIGPGGTYIAPV